jgi:hypothetical protein
MFLLNFFDEKNESRMLGFCRNAGWNMDKGGGGVSQWRVALIEQQRGMVAFHIFISKTLLVLKTFGIYTSFIAH